VVSKNIAAEAGMVVLEFKDTLRVRAIVAAEDEDVRLAKMNRGRGDNCTRRIGNPAPAFATLFVWLISPTVV